jgi:antagonist of KipI
MGMKIEDGGILTSIQDGGRFGYEQFGVSPSGPMDAKAMHIGNILVDNEIGESCLETTIMGPTICFEENAVVAITGADCAPTINGKNVSMYRALSINAGDVLKLGMVKNGCRSYLAIAGGIDVPVLMNSKCTMVGKNFGGFEGRKLQKGDVLKLAKSVSTLPNMAARLIIPEKMVQGVHTLRVILGPQEERFTEKGIETFLNSEYKVGQAFDRQGYRLEGPVIEHTTDSNIISDGIVTGSVQVPGDGHPIVMLAEHQTIGGYTKIATVASIDLPVIGQCKAGDIIRFQQISVEEAENLYVAYHKELDALKVKMRTPVTYKPARNLTLTIDGKAWNVTIEERED